MSKGAALGFYQPAWVPKILQHMDEMNCKASGSHPGVEAVRRANQHCREGPATLGQPQRPAKHILAVVDPVRIDVLDLHGVLRL